MYPRRHEDFPAMNGVYQPISPTRPGSSTVQWRACRATAGRDRVVCLASEKGRRHDDADRSWILGAGSGVYLRVFIYLASWCWADRPEPAHLQSRGYSARSRY